MKILEVNNITKVYGQGDCAVRAVDNISFSLNRGEFIAIVGSSGSGKSTLLHIVGGLDYPDKGEVIINNTVLGALSDNELTLFRRKNIGFIFQSFNLIQQLTVYENIVLTIELEGRNPDKEFIYQIVSDLGLDKKLDNSPNELSGGQQQRVAIARALATQPAIILADEPTGNLDKKSSIEVMKLLKIASKKYNQSVIMITHNDELAKMTDRIICIEDGAIYEEQA
ncbi:MAG: ABC transporter ATP-binding protein [Herbinix sp.]|nr:ABC transporter ATP-binding protein [Herbinix sp.]